MHEEHVCCTIHVNRLDLTLLISRLFLIYAVDSSNIYECLWFHKLMKVVNEVDFRHSILRNIENY